MKTLLIGKMQRMEALLHWLACAEEAFELELIMSEDRIASEYFTCEIKHVSEMESLTSCYDIVFLCSDRSLQVKYRTILELLQFPAGIIKTDMEITAFLTPRLKMDYYAKKLEVQHQSKYRNDNITVGEFTYGIPIVEQYENHTNLKIGKFCSIGPDVKIVLGGGHRTDWCTTYPFNAIMPEFSDITGHPCSKGDIVIGNDVWIAGGAKIMSGVTIGDGSVIAANACVTSDVEPYTIVGGVPAKEIGKRFEAEDVRRLLAIKWWDWDKELILQAVPLLQNQSPKELFDFYEKFVLPERTSAGAALLIDF